MKTDELREKYLAFFETKGCVRRPSDVLVPRWDPSVLFTPGRHEPVQGPFPRPLQAGFHPGHDLPEMPPHGRHRQRRPHRLSPHVLRDAGQLQLRRLFQARGDPLGLGVPDQQEVAGPGRRKSSRPRSISTTTRRPAFGSTRSSCRPTGCSGWARTRTSGRPTPPAKGPTASAARAAKSTSTRPSARSKSGTWSSPSSTAWAIRPTTCARCRARTSTRAWAWSGRPRCCRASSRTSTSTSSARWSRRPARCAACATIRPTRTAAACAASPTTSAPARSPSTKTSIPATRSRATSSAGCCAARCSTATRWASASRSCTSWSARWPS